MMFWKLFLALLVLEFAHAEVFKFSLTKHKGLTETLREERKFKELRQLHSKLLKKFDTKTRASRLATQTQPMEEHGSVYTANMTFGTPQQEFIMLVDTAVTDTWIPDKTCTGTECTCTVDSCMFPKDYFDSSKSSSYMKDGRTFSEYNNIVLGFLGVDTVGLGAKGSQQLVIPKATFGQVTQSFPDYMSYPIDGVLGLAFAAASADGAKPIFQEAVDQGLVDKPIFSMWMKNEVPGNVDPSAGMITWGGLDTTNCDPNVMYVPLTAEDVWRFSVSSVEIGKYKQTGPFSAAFDTATVLTIVPDAVMQDIATATGATFDFNYGVYQVDCNTKFTWFMYLGTNQVVGIDESTGIMPFGDICYLSFDYVDGVGIDFIFGDPLSKKFCVVYDTAGSGQFGLAASLTM